MAGDVGSVERAGEERHLRGRGGGQSGEGFEGRLAVVLVDGFVREQGVGGREEHGHGRIEVIVRGVLWEVASGTFAARSGRRGERVHGGEDEAGGWRVDGLHGINRWCV